MSGTPAGTSNAVVVSSRYVGAHASSSTDHINVVHTMFGFTGYRGSVISSRVTTRVLHVTAVGRDTDTVKKRAVAF